ncbi:AAA family ATPase, partial [Tistlia consotensis]
AFYGPSGFGKSVSAAYAANSHRAYYVEAKASWTRRFFLLSVLREMGIEPAKTIPEMVEQISEQLVLSRRPLIIDEMDHVVDRRMVDLVRDIYDGSASPILLIGEEQLPAKLKRWERFDGRILEWAPAQPLDLGDARHLRRLYVRRVEIADDLLQHLVELAHGSARRLCVNLDRIEKEAQAMGADRIDRAAWGDRPLYTGEAPKRRLS